MLGQYKKIIIAIIVILVIAIAYKSLNKSSKSISDNFERTTAVGTQTAENTLGKDLIEKLNRIKSITLDKSIFSDKVYVYLISKSSKNLSDKIEEQPVGFSRKRNC